MPNTQTGQASLLAGGLKERLEQLGMSRRELARRTGLSRQTIHNIEHEGATNLKPSTFIALDGALKWEPGTALSLALGKGNARTIEEKLMEYLGRIAIHLSHMSSEELELTAIMLEEHQLGTANHSTAEFSRKVGKLIENCLKQVTELNKATHKHAC